jgi:uncharacterized membrane protein
MPTAFSLHQALSFGWSKMRENLSLFIVMCVSSFFVGTIQESLRQASSHPLRGMGLVALGLHVAHVLLTMGWIKAALLLHDGEEVMEVAELTPTLPLFLTYSVGLILYTLVVLAGLVLLIVPGLLLAVRYGFFGFLILDKQLDPITALRRSAELTRGLTAELLVFGLALLGLNLLGALALGVGLLATLPTSAIAAAYVYRRLLRRSEVLDPAVHPPLDAQHAAA